MRMHARVGCGAWVYAGRPLWPKHSCPLRLSMEAKEKREETTGDGKKQKKRKRRRRRRRRKN